MTNTLLDRTGLLANMVTSNDICVFCVESQTYNRSICMVPNTVATGSTPDISPLLQFTWWEPVYYKVDDSDFPSETHEK
jgi:hypothetical protein